MRAPLTDSTGNSQAKTAEKRRAAAAFCVMQRADDPDIARANAQLKADMQGGANGVAVVFEGAHNACGYGLPAAPETLEALFDGVDVAKLQHIRIDNHPHGLALTEKCAEFLQKRRAGKNTKITFGTDPAAALATTGRLKMSLNALKASLPQSMSAFFSAGLPGVVLEADGRPFHNAGATPAQEIGVMLSSARSHLQMAENGRHHIAYALPHIGFAAALSQDPAQNIAKLHVLQTLWAKLQRECGIDSPAIAPVHAESSLRMMTAQDSGANISRAAAAAFSAVAGNAVSAAALPYSLPRGLPDAQARRAALMSLLVFTREAAPSGLISGSALMPNPVLAEKLAAAAWEEFQLLEREGGILQSLTEGKLQKRIEETQALSVAAYLEAGRGFAGGAAENEAAAEKSGIYAQKPVAFAPQGMEHCAPLPQQRLETVLAEARAAALAEPR